MRVLIVADVVGGVRTFVHELTEGLTGLGAEVHLALIGRDRSRVAPTAASATAPTAACGTAPTAASCEVRDLKLEWMPDPWRDVEATGEWVGELIAHHRPDVVHMNTFAPVPDAGIRVLLTVHSCVVTWWRAVHNCEAPAGWTRYRRVARRALDRADVVCVPTRALLNELIAAYGNLRCARVIPNGRTIAPPPAGAPRRDRLVVSVGRLWDAAKNAALVASAAPAIDGRVVLIGPAGPSGIESLGELPPTEVLRWLRRAAVFAEPARYEPFGLAALEAALCGCALVLGDIPSLREVWYDGASFVGPDDRDALVHAVNALLQDPAQCRRAANAARTRATGYARSAMAGAYLDVYREVARLAIPA